MMKDYLSPESIVIVLCSEQEVMTSSVSGSAKKEMYESFDLFDELNYSV